MKNIFIILLLFLISCNNNGCAISINSNILPVNESLSDIENKKSKVLLFLFENDTISQKLEIVTMTDSVIDFVLTSHNKLKNVTSKIEGKASSDPKLDPEIDEDEEGNAYPSQQYIYKNECLLYIRIDLQLKDKIKIAEVNCEKKRTIYTPFNSVGIIKRIW